MEQPIVCIENVTKRFDGLTAVDRVSIDVRSGEFLTLLGPSGCGKTTILRLIAGFEEADEGEIRIAGRRVNGMPPNVRDVNTVFQSYALFPHMTVFENIAFGLKIKRRPAAEIRRKVRAILEMVKMEGMEERRIGRLSGGQQQRVAIARAVVNEPVVLLLDEPLSALDYRLRKEMQLELKHLQRKLGITFIFVTHDQEEAIAMSDRILVMRDGRVEQQGTPREIYEEPVNLFVAQFVGEINVFDGRVLATRGDRMRTRIEQVDFELANRKGFDVGRSVKILLRPEDIKVSRLAEGCVGPYMKGAIVETVYKGITVDLVVKLASGKTIQVTEFFNEDAEEIHYDREEPVCVSWIDGWEVALPDD